MNPAFNRSMPVQTFGNVVPYLFALIDQESDNVPITIRMKSFTLDVLGLAAFGMYIVNIIFNSLTCTISRF